MIRVWGEDVDEEGEDSAALTPERLDGGQHARDEGATARAIGPEAGLAMNDTGAEGSVAEIAAAIRASPVVSIDETSWVEDRRTSWLWSATTPELAYYHIAGRTRVVAHQLLGEDFEGIVVSDRMASYADRAPDHRQVCWAHLDRTFGGIVARGGSGARFGQAMQNLTARTWKAWGALRDGRRTRASLERFASRRAIKVRKILREFSALHIPKVTSLAANLLAIEPALRTFVHRPDVEPTNNPAFNPHISEARSRSCHMRPLELSSRFIGAACRQADRRQERSTGIPSGAQTAGSTDANSGAAEPRDRADRAAAHAQNRKLIAHRQRLGELQDTVAEHLDRGADPRSMGDRARQGCARRAPGGDLPRLARRQRAPRCRRSRDPWRRATEHPEPCVARPLLRAAQ